MGRVLKSLAWVALGLVVFGSCVFAWGRLRPPTTEQQRALTLLQQDLKPTHGRNANPWLWFMGFDVPADRVDAAYEKEHQRLLALAATYRAGNVPVEPMTGPQTDFPKLPAMSSAERNALCKMREADCLTKVRAHSEDLRALLTRHEQLLNRDKALRGFDYVWSDMPAGPYVPIPPFGTGMGLWQTSIALNFIDGKQAQAIDEACTQVSTMRRLHAHANSLVATMVFAARLRGSVRLFTELLAEFPAGDALPASCADAFAPVTVEDVDLCSSMQEEFVLVAAPELYERSEPARWYENWSWSAKLTQRLMATDYGALCEPTLARRLLADERVDVARDPPRIDLFDLFADSAGAILSQIPLPLLNGYIARQQDVAATLRMGALMMWLRESRDGDTSLQQRITRRPSWMVFSERRDFGLSSDGQNMTMQMLDSQGQSGEPWPTSWPLPVAH
jgi:hypothetical protein